MSPESEAREPSRTRLGEHPRRGDGEPLGDLPGGHKPGWCRGGDASIVHGLLVLVGLGLEDPVDDDVLFVDTRTARARARLRVVRRRVAEGRHLVRIRPEPVDAIDALRRGRRIRLLPRRMRGVAGVGRVGGIGVHSQDEDAA